MAVSSTFRSYTATGWLSSQPARSSRFFIAADVAFVGTARSGPLLAIVAATSLTESPSVIFDASLDTADAFGVAPHACDEGLVISAITRIVCLEAGPEDPVGHLLA